jgi:hypothetical protein
MKVSGRTSGAARSKVVADSMPSLVALQRCEVGFDRRNCRSVAIDAFGAGRENPDGEQ